MNLTRIFSIVLFLVSLALAGYLYYNINSTIQFKEHVSETEKKITDKLAVIREAEKAYLERYGKYTASWDTLINFINNGRVPITVRTEKITQLSYGEEKVEVVIDTVGFMSARDRIFKKNFQLNASTDGTFVTYLAKEGDYVAQGTPAYRLRLPNGKVEMFKFTDSGTITSLRKLNQGDPIKRGNLMANMWEYQLNPQVDVNNLASVPGSNEKFDIYVGKVKRGNIDANVIEVRDPAPINPDRKATNEARTRQPLGFGSRVDVNTGGNWE